MTDDVFGSFCRGPWGAADLHGGAAGLLQLPGHRAEADEANRLVPHCESVLFLKHTLVGFQANGRDTARLGLFMKLPLL